MRAELGGGRNCKLFGSNCDSIDMDKTHEHVTTVASQDSKRVPLT